MKRFICSAAVAASVSLLVLFLPISSGPAAADEFAAAFPAGAERVWIGPEYWARPMQDWRLSHGRIECVFGGGGRAVYLLNVQLNEKVAPFETEVHLGKLAPGDDKTTKGWAGFRLGIRGAVNEYRHNVLHGRTGLDAGVDAAGRLFIGNFQPDDKRKSDLAGKLGDLRLKLAAQPGTDGRFRLTLTAFDPKGAVLGRIERQGVPAARLVGSVALFCHTFLPQPGGMRRLLPPDQRQDSLRFWFSEWKLAGERVSVNPEHVFGPILFSQYSLSRNVLKITAQMPPIGTSDCQGVRLEFRDKEGHLYQTRAAEIDPHSRTATIRIAGWDSTRDTPYRLVYPFTGTDGETRDYYWTGTIRRDPVDKDPLKLAVVGCRYDSAFPDFEIVRRLKAQNPDILFFYGDQIYEGNEGFGFQNRPSGKGND